MNEFFLTLFKNFNDLIKRKHFEMLDWLFTEEKFLKEQGWTRGYISSFTKKIKNYIPKDKYIYKEKNEINFPNKSHGELIVFKKSDNSEGINLIKHIRNGIAHGRAKLKTIKKENWIELIDYKGSEQTAYMKMPFNLVFEFYEIYQDISKKIGKGEN